MGDTVGYLGFLLAITLIAGAHGREHSLIGEYHKVTSWLGHRLVLRDGCPKVPCDPKRRSCVKVNLQIEARYEKCLSEEAKARNGTVDEQGVLYNKDGTVMEPLRGCITDQLRSGPLVAPIFAHFCSRHCYYLIPHNSIYYYDHEDINTAKQGRRGRLEILEQPSPPTKGSGAPRLNRLHICPYVGFDHDNVDQYYTF